MDVDCGPHLQSITISGQTTLWERRILLPGFVSVHGKTLKKITLEENMIDAAELTNLCEKCQNVSCALEAPTLLS